jgi:hypothetical protein
MKRLRITYKDILRMERKAMRETTHDVKPIVYKDKKKAVNKTACRKFRY